MIWCYLEKIYYAWEWHKNSKRRTSISMTIWFSSCSRIMVALKQVITLAEQQKSDRLVKMELPDRMRPLATLQQSSLITEGWIPGKKHSFIGIAILESVCVWGEGRASNFTIRDIRNDIIIDLYRVRACRAGQRDWVIWVMPAKRKEFLVRAVFLFPCYNLLCQRVNKLLK